MRDRLIVVALICIAISLSGCTGISSIHIPGFWGSPASTPQPPSEPLNSIISSNTIPTKMLPGQVYKVSVTMRNDGYLSWSNANKILLAPAYDPDNDTILFNNASFIIDPDTIVKTGSDYTWNISLVAPKWIGNYTIKYQLKDQNDTYFGDILVKNVTVGDLNSTVVFVSQNVVYYPPLGSMTIQKNTLKNASITVRNMGRSGWSENEQVRLAMVDYEPNDATLFNEALLFHIAPEQTVQPSDQCTWKLVLHAPSSPGTYKLEYQMKQGDEWLGKPLIVYITVK